MRVPGAVMLLGCLQGPRGRNVPDYRLFPETSESCRQSCHFAHRRPTIGNCPLKPNNAAVRKLAHYRNSAFRLYSANLHSFNPALAAQTCSQCWLLFSVGSFSQRSLLVLVKTEVAVGRMVENVVFMLYLPTNKVKTLLFGSMTNTVKNAFPIKNQ